MLLIFSDFFLRLNRLGHVGRARNGGQHCDLIRRVNHEGMFSRLCSLLDGGEEVVIVANVESRKQIAKRVTLAGHLLGHL